METILPNLRRWVSKQSGPQHPVNSYVWLRDGGAAVIDPSAEVTPVVIKPLGMNQVADVLVTHVQEENIAGATHFPGARVHVPVGDEYLCEGPEAYQKCYVKW